SSRLGFLLAFTSGTVSLLLGNAGPARESLERAIDLGSALGDSHLVGFARVHLSEALLLSGDYRAAITRLSKLEAETGEANLVLVRMILSRRLALETLVGRRRSAAQALEKLERLERSNVDLLEAWNDVYVGLAAAATKSPAALERLESARATFRKLGVPYGESFASLGLLLHALVTERRGSIARCRRTLETGRSEGHRFLSVAIPLARAEAALTLGDRDLAAEDLDVASAAIVGSPFLELDARLELLRARIAMPLRRVSDVRNHLHRAAQVREILAQRVPSRARERFLDLRRFREIDEFEERVQKTPRLLDTASTENTVPRLDGFVGAAASLRSLFELVPQVAEHEFPVLIHGETGTGKEIIARAIHRRGPRARRPFLAVHCAALTSELFESEFFGHAKGAFTGAEEDHDGVLDAISGGTLLLDEVASLSLDLQARVLKVIDSGQFRRLGEVGVRQSDVRFLASTSVDLAARVEEGEFRADLYYRLVSVELTIPPLRDRMEDLQPLSRHLIEKHSNRLGKPVAVLESEGLEGRQRPDGERRFSRRP
ncbi:MAG: sigma 54-interacting transcriptional regulator, partial [Planctomycetota bacterium]